MTRVVIIGLGMMLSMSPCLADDREKGLAIAQRADEISQGFGDSSALVEMTLISSDGRSRTRSLTWQVLEAQNPGEGDRSLTVFHEPRDIAGTGFLSIARTDAEDEDEQWLYLPALKRSKRISASNKTSAFVGSEFSYEDLLSDELDRFTYRWLRDAPCGDWNCHVIERIPVDPHSGYGKQIVWLDEDQFRLARVEYFDREGEYLKLLELGAYEQYLDRYWRPTEMRMSNVRTGKQTYLLFKDIALQAGLSAQEFLPSRLRRIGE